MELYDPYEMVEKSKEIIRRPPGIVYDKIMSEYDCPWDKSYPEGPARYISVFNRIKELGLLSKMTQIVSRKATRKEVLTCHTLELFKKLKKTRNVHDLESLEQQSAQYDAIYLHPNAYEAALYAAGSTIELVDQICMDKIPSGFALVRPPGHHAMEDEFCGYCYFNNVALAAKHAIDNYNVKKILIVDWDVHHGQATQQMFYEDNRVLYFSVHRYEHGTFWPNLRESDFDYIGVGSGSGYNFNVPLNKTGMTNTDYMAIFHRLLLPVACEYQPELIIISAGYDAAEGCPEGEMLLTPAFYAHMLWSLKNLAYGKVAVVLEGGYCLKSLAEGAALTVRSLIGEPCPSIGALGKPCREIVETINNVIFSRHGLWKCFVRDQGSEENGYCSEVKFLHNEEKPTSYPTRDCYPVQSEKFLRSVDKKLDALRKSTQLTFAPNSVCFVYDPDMMLHDPTQSSGVQHPEDPLRIAHAFKKFQDFEIIPRCKRLESRSITKREMESVHGRNYVDFLRKVSKGTPEEQRKAEQDYISVTFCKHSYHSALLAAGSLLQVVDEVMTGQSQSGVAIIRPPGHHAMYSEPHGFCLLNNVAVAARYAQSKYDLERILILDWDVHHGNGTQEIFYEDSSVLYVSLHVYADGKFFPFLASATAAFSGINDGAGFNVNIPWRKFGVGDKDYLAAFYAVVLPIAYQYDPQLVIVSAGFDAAINDQIGKCKVTPEAYGHMTHYLSALANGKIILALEGGYNKESLATSLACCTKTLLGDPVPFMDAASNDLEEAETINEVVNIHKKYWPCLRLTEEVDNLNDEASSTVADSSHSSTSNTTIEDLDKLNDEASSPVADSSHNSTSNTSIEDLDKLNDEASSTVADSSHSSTSDTTIENLDKLNDEASSTVADSSHSSTSNTSIEDLDKLNDEATSPVADSSRSSTSDTTIENLDKLSDEATSPVADSSHSSTSDTTIENLDKLSDEATSPVADSSHSSTSDTTIEDLDKLNDEASSPVADSSHSSTSNTSIEDLDKLNDEATSPVADSSHSSTSDTTIENLDKLSDEATSPVADSSHSSTSDTRIENSDNLNDEAPSTVTDSSHSSTSDTTIENLDKLNDEATSPVADSSHSSTSDTTIENLDKLNDEASSTVADSSHNSTLDTTIENLSSELESVHMDSSTEEPEVKSCSPCSTESQVHLKERPCCADDLKEVGDTTVAKTCSTYVICKKICSWQCSNCAVEMCSNCKKAHIE